VVDVLLELSMADEDSRTTEGKLGGVIERPLSQLPQRCILLGRADVIQR